MKKLLIDINSIVPYLASGKTTGIGRTTLELVNALGELYNSLPFETQLFSQNIKGIKINKLQSPFKSKHLYLPNRVFINKCVQSIPIKELITGYDIMHIPHNFEYVFNPEKTLVTIHDAMFFSYPEKFLGHDFARKNYPKLAQNCKGIVTCSESSKNDIVNFMKINENKITVIPWGVDHKTFYPLESSYVRTKLISKGLDQPYFIMVSCDIGRKNTYALMQSFRQFSQKKSEHILLLVWRNPPKEYITEFSKEIEKGQIRIIANIDDETLNLFYNGATASFFPSKYEGFGLPVIESMACGTPVITCNNSSLGEVGGKVALYTDPNNLDQMADFMWQFEKGNLNLSELKEKSLTHAAQYNWSRTAEQYIQFYQKYI